MHVPQFDYLIIGQGLAGSILAFQLIARGQRVMVIDNDHKGSASQVAAGIINPITGHRLNLTDGFVGYYFSASTLYQQLEQTLEVNLIRKIDQVRLLKNPGQASYFHKRLDQDDYVHFIEANKEASLFMNTEYGTAKIKQTSIVDTELLLQTLKKWLVDRNAYRNTYVDYSELIFAVDGVGYQDFSASRVIFCEGYQAINNPWLKDLPFKLAKGEILTIERQSNHESMMSWGNWLIPSTNDVAKLGANYAWNDTDLQPSDTTRAKLLESLRDQTGLEPTVLNHQVGIRPTTTHRHAFVGSISKQERAFCFNGFGSKGCLTIPAHAEFLCDHLLNDTLLPKELNQWL